MTPLDALERIKEFTEANIAPCLLMRKEPVHSGDVMDLSEDKVELVHPAVTTGTMPHKNFQPVDFQIPMILWTFDEADDSGEDSEGRKINIRAFVGAYSNELYASEDTKLPDNKAFKDLVNALEKIYQELTKHHIVNGVGREKKISYGIYDGLYYPYSYGWLTFTAEIERMQYEDDYIDSLV
jgi:hypothetical protein